jgi:hypothetical protein
MGYVATRTVRISGRRYLPGEAIESNPQKWKGLNYLLAHGYIAGYPDSLVESTDTELSTLRAEAKELGIKGFGSMKKDTLIAKIAEIKTIQGNLNDQIPPTGGDINVDVLGGSNQQPEGQNPV